jgi:hypothetical protein
MKYFIYNTDFRKILLFFNTKFKQLSRVILINRIDKEELRRIERGEKIIIIIFLSNIYFFPTFFSLSSYRLCNPPTRKQKTDPTLKQKTTKTHI